MSETEAMRPLPGGLAGWLFGMMEGLTGAVGRKSRTRQLQVLETLALGNRRQLLLVRCGRAEFLVGTGSDGVSTMVRVTGNQKKHGGIRIRNANAPGSAVDSLHAPLQRSTAPETL